MIHPSGIKVKGSIKAGGLTSVNHNRTAIKVRSGLRAAGISSNHNARLFAL